MVIHAEPSPPPSRQNAYIVSIRYPQVSKRLQARPSPEEMHARHIVHTDAEVASRQAEANAAKSMLEEMYGPESSSADGGDGKGQVSEGGTRLGCVLLCSMFQRQIVKRSGLVALRRTMHVMPHTLLRIENRLL